MKSTFTGVRLFLPLVTLSVASCGGVSPAGPDPGTPGPTATGGRGAATETPGGSAGTGGAPDAGAGTLPCDVAAVVQAKCQSCHGVTPQFGAPMSLVTYGDTQAPGHSLPSSKIWQVMQSRVHDTKKPMPPAGQPPLASAELATLDGWFAANAPSATTACGPVVRGTGGAAGGAAVGTGGSGGNSTLAIGPQALPCTPSHVLTAHAAGSTTKKYAVAKPTNDSYVCFNFKSPFAAGEQATAWAPIIDDSRVIHHWILFGSNSNLTDGSISSNCISPSLSGTHVAGWAPGGQNTVLDPDVGLVLDYPYFQLQIHYNNQLYTDGADASGIAFCSTTTPRTNAAGIVTLGPSTFNIPANANDYAVTSNCSNLASDRKTTMTVIGTSPHMHLLGTGFVTQHSHGAMDMGNISNVPIGSWSFDSQRHYSLNPRRQILPGDSLKTTCYFDNPSASAVSFGTKTSDEMCFDFITVYPYAMATKSCRF